MPCHDEAVRQRCIVLGFFLRTYLPPPAAVDISRMCRIHQSDHCMIDVAVEQLTLDPPWPCVRRRNLGWLRSWRAVAWVRRHVDPNQSVLFANWIRADANVGRI